MKSKISIVSDYSRRIEFKDILVLYEQKYLSPKTMFEDSSISQSELALIDISDLDLAVTVMNEIRVVSASMPLVVIVGQQDYKKAQSVFIKTKGFGRISLVYWHPKEQYRLLEVLQECLHPELPSHREEIAVVIPVYNEFERIHHVRHFLDELNKMIGLGFPNTSIYLINDGSIDDTEQEVDKYLEEMVSKREDVIYKPALSHKVLKMNTKKAGTYMEAFQNIDADIFVYADADDSFVISDIARMINIIKEGYYDMVIGTKDQTAIERSLSRKILSFIKRRLTSSFLPKNVTDSQTGLKVFSRQVVNYMSPHLKRSYGLAIDLKILYLAKRYNFRVYQLPVRCIDREGSHVQILKDGTHFIASMWKIIWDTKHIKLNLK